MKETKGLSDKEVSELYSREKKLHSAGPKSIYNALPEDK
jgi:hypothetical protein